MSAGETEQQLSFESLGEEPSAVEAPETGAGVATAAAAPEPVANPFPPTSEQAAAIDGRERDVFLEAGAGTGKTRVLVDRYCDAVDLDGIEPERILAFTFTEKAAAEMRRRVRVELARRARASADPERRARLTKASRAGEGAPITTIHGFCRRLLASHPVAAGLDPHFRVLDAEEAARLARLAFEAALDRLASTDPAVVRIAAGYRGRLGGMIRAAHDDLRNHGRPVELPPLQITAFDSEGPPDPAEVEAMASAYEAIRSLLVAFAAEYEQVKSERSGVDFDDLQLFALTLLRESPALGAAYASRFDHLLVDEFQDTSPLQVALVAALRGPETRLFSVGDEFQSIYAFRGADLASFRAERERIRDEQGPGAVLPLSGSFRSTPAVVAAVNAIGACLLEDFQPLRVGRLPEADPPGPPGPSIELVLTERGNWTEENIELPTAASETAPNRIAEARRLALRLRELADGGVDPGSMVLLLRAFSHVDAYAEALELAGLDPYVVGGRGYWSAQQVEDALRLLACVANPLEDEALFGALASPACAASPDALWILRRIAGKGRHIWPAIREHLLEADEPDDKEEADAPPPDPDPEELELRRQAAEWAGRLDESDREQIAGFAAKLRELRERAALLPLDELVERTLERFDYDLAALAMPGGRRRAANLLKLIRIAGEYESHEGRDLRGFLAYARERAALSDREAEAATAAEEHPGVTVMTIHAAKGLEFDCVAVADLGRGLAASGAPPELRLDFGAEGDAEADDEGHQDESPSADAEPGGPRVGLRLARAGAGSLSLDGYRDLNDAAARAEAQESGRLVYVAASRARERLILSGLFDPHDITGGRPELKPSHSALAHLLPALGVGEELEQRVAIPPAEPRGDLDAAFEAPEIAVSLLHAGPESAEELRFDLRADAPDDAIEPGGRPPLLALAERGGSAARSLSYAALAEYRRCGYRFLTERVLGLGADQQASPPLDPGGADPAPGHGRHEPDEEPLAPAPAPGAAGGAREARLGFGRAVHGLLEWSARNEWAMPDHARLAAALGAEGAQPAAADAAGALVSAWLDSELLAELREAGASFRPEVAFRVRLGETVLRGSIDLLASVPGEPPLVIDYKTDSQVAGREAELDEAYALQRSLYALAVGEATDAGSVASAYVFLQEPGAPLRSLLDEAAIAAGRERIAELVGRIRARDFAPTEHPHAGLCHDCPARPRLCPHPPERTLSTA